MTDKTSLIIIAGFVSFVACCSLSGDLHAAVPPRPAEGLFVDADVVVVAEVTDLAMRKQRSTIEKGFGNYDWDIHCTLRIKAVEKGNVNHGDQIAAHCFAIHTRKSALEYLSLQSHAPIPEIGQTVRAYLRRAGPEFSVLHPNGFAAADGDTILQTRLVRSRGFTCLLPIELWALALVVGLAAWTLARVVRFISTHRSLKSKMPNGVYRRP